MTSKDISKLSFDVAVAALNAERAPSTSVGASTLGTINLGTGNLTVYSSPSTSSSKQKLNVKYVNNLYIFTFGRREYKINKVNYTGWYSDGTNLWLAINLVIKASTGHQITGVKNGLEFNFDITHYIRDGRNYTEKSVYTLNKSVFNHTDKHQETLTMSNGNNKYNVVVTFTVTQRAAHGATEVIATWMDEQGHTKSIKGFVIPKTTTKTYVSFTLNTTPDSGANLMIDMNRAITPEGRIAGLMDDDPGTPAPTGDPNGEGDPKIPFQPSTITEWLLGDGNFNNPQYAAEEQYYEELYGNTGTQWSTKSFNSIIGMPFHFMANVDPRVGASPLGKQFIEDIVYDMPLVCMRPGGPVMNSSISGDSSDKGLLGFARKAYSYYYFFIKNHKTTFKTLASDDDEAMPGVTDALETIMLNLFVGKYARFYTFGSDMYKYIEYVNTLCHLFISFLDIGDIMYTPGNGDAPRKYAYYNDTWEHSESDSGASMKLMYGPNKAIFGYYQPENP